MTTAYRTLLAVLLIGLLPWSLTAQVTSVPALRDSARRVNLTQGIQYLNTADYARAGELLTTVPYDGAGRMIVDSLSGLALHKLGVLAFSEAEDSLSAHWFQEAIGVRDSIYAGPHNDRAHSRGGLADPLSYLGRLDEAMDVIREAVAIYESVADVDSLNLLRSLNTLSNVAQQRRNFQLALSASYRALTLLDGMHGISPDDAFYTCYNASIVQLRLDKLNQALVNARRSLTYASLTKYDEAANTASAYNQLAITQRELGDEEASFHSLTKGVEVLVASNPESYILGYLYLNLAEYHGGKGNAAKGDVFDGRARKVFDDSGMLREYAIVDKYPRALHAMGRSEQAIALINQKLGYLGTSPGDTVGRWAINHPGDIVPMIDLLSARAEFLTALNKGNAALKDYNTVLSLQDHLRSRVSDFDSRSYLSKNLRPFFDNAIALHYRAYCNTQDTAHLWEAFALSERARSYSLLANLRSAGQRTVEEQRLNERIAALERRVAEGETAQRDVLAEARIQLDLLRESSESTPPQPFVLDRGVLTEYIKRNECTLLEYHLGSSLGLVFVVTPDGRLSVYPIEGAADLNAEINRWRESIAEGEYRRKSLRPVAVQDSLDRQFLEQGLRLTHQLIPPPVLNSLHLRPRLCIVPDGGLNYLPFAALPLEAAPLPLDYHTVKYLQGKTDVHYAYSAGFVLEVAQRPARTYEEDLLAFAPTFRPGRGTLHPLANNKDEVSQIAKLVARTTAFYGREANRDNFLASLGRARMLHLSSHGSVHPGNPNLSYVAFSQLGDSIDRAEMLYFNDLRNLPLDNELTVLSACETSLGELAAGETTMSFASALASAGARSTLTTLWEVDDRATKGLIVDFYRRLVNGEGRATALNHAQADHRSSPDYAHPYYWSGVVLYGDPGPIVLTDSWSVGAVPVVGWGIGGVLALLVAGLLLFRLRGGDYSARRDRPDSLVDNRSQ
ncbi:CHAT domain-containing protein [Lewinella aquimaris]|uniref:CHAT domain-containing protein n=1 Tax=Neolewinella aquimaris TaxID=1835722 RepID=A0A840E1M6_9BACT|nr:CHAT domain-containing protein [Neolewinella aquimaris]MBB4079000.1 CHAT domain-containing protein [Neolewinella aquimaris]